jgi:hypothetical protein
MNINARINRRANQANQIKCYGLNTPKEGVFFWSFRVNAFEPIEEELYLFKRRGTNYYN